MVNTRQINTRFSIRHQLKVMDNILKETYNGKLRYELRRGRSSADCLKFEVHPIIEQKTDKTIVRIEFTDFDGYTRRLDMKAVIEETGSHKGMCYSHYDYDKKQSVYVSVGMAVDRLIYRVFTLDSFVHDTTAIPIYI